MTPRHARLFEDPDFLQGGESEPHTIVWTEEGRIVDLPVDDDDIIFERLRKALGGQRQASEKGLHSALVDATVEAALESKRATATFYFCPPFGHPRAVRNIHILGVSFGSGWFSQPESAVAEPPTEGEMNSHREASKGNATSESEVARLRGKIQFLEHQLQSDRLHLRLYRLGAGAFLLGAFSLLVWLFTGVGAPFHPVFSVITLPVSAAIMGMAFLARPARSRD